MHERKASSIPVFLLRTTFIHTLTYFAAGILFSSILDYRRVLAEPVIRDYMVEFGSPAVGWGPWFQPLRGLVMDGANPAYVLLAPVIPALIVAAVARPGGKDAGSAQRP